jgi:hypothetical protein
MVEAPARAAESRPRNKRLRFGLRGLLILILLLGLVFGWIARMQQQAREQEFLVADLARDRIIVNHPGPTLLCLILMKALAPDGRDIEARCARWLGPGWFSHPRGFNAGRLKEEQVASVVERLRRLGTVWEETYTTPSLAGLKLFYIDQVPYNSLGPDGRTCIIRQHPTLLPAQESDFSRDGRGIRR